MNDIDGDLQLQQKLLFELGHGKMMAEGVEAMAAATAAHSQLQCWPVAGT